MGWEDVMRDEVNDFHQLPLSAARFDVKGWVFCLDVNCIAMHECVEGGWMILTHGFGDVLHIHHLQGMLLIGGCFVHLEDE